ncbi:MAG: FtsQ-type POTRA domain-containing protein [Candidatus Promineifilaceae bacterium]|nr:FtsQ-type POTRA domain-containing protein [Candidatus Promineifilaceae bacterium]
MARKRKRKLKKQPRMRRAQASSTNVLPTVTVPPKAKWRRRRNKLQLKLPLTAIKEIATSARWISLVLLAVSVAALVLVHRGEAFYLTAIPVEGADSIPAAEIVQSSGLGAAHIFAADPSEAAARVGQVPGVVSATVRLEWPNQAAIRIEEDVPIALLQHGGERYWINDAGELIPRRNETSGLLVLEVESGETFSDTVTLPTDVLHGALQLRDLRPNIDRLFYSAANGLTYQDGRGWRAHFGTGLDMAQKLVIYETIIEKLLEQGVTPAYVSVANQEKPFYKPIGN